ncbi:MAG: hypothetical protein QOF91_3228, partial [Alphaproteobacteria bacterium]|nr:hypothetical protein [Alphaproteobacteria bacterium]
MTHRIMSAKARTASKVLATLTATIMLVVVGAVHSVAQQAPAPAPAPKPRAAPAKPAQPAQQQAPAAQQQPQPQQQQAPQGQAQAPGGDAPQLIFSPWVKLCNKDADPKAKRICVTVKDGRVESGLLVVSVAIIEMD